MTRREIASAHFLEGYNCAQSVVITFADVLGKDPEELAKNISAFGGGMGRLREVCGAVSGMFAVLSMLYGYSDPKAKEEKMELYKRVQELAKKFEEKNGAIVCRELLHLQVKRQDPKPEERTPEYYQKRNCAEYVGDAAEIVEEFIKNNPIV